MELVKSGWVYFIEADCQSLFKIGFTMGEPEERLRQLQTASPHPLVLLMAFKVDHPQIVEKHFQTIFENTTRRTIGEWFACKREEVYGALAHFFAAWLNGLGVTEVRGADTKSLPCSS